MTLSPYWPLSYSQAEGALLCLQEEWRTRFKQCPYHSLQIDRGNNWGKPVGHLSPALLQTLWRGAGRADKEKGAQRVDRSGGWGGTE
jgi:hypothetical protein